MQHDYNDAQSVCSQVNSNTVLAPVRTLAPDILEQLRKLISLPDSLDAFLRTNVYSWDVIIVTSVIVAQMVNGAAHWGAA